MWQGRGEAAAHSKFLSWSTGRMTAPHRVRRLKSRFGVKKTLDFSFRHVELNLQMRCIAGEISRQLAACVGSKERNLARGTDLLFTSVSIQIKVRYQRNQQYSDSNRIAYFPNTF